MRLSTFCGLRRDQEQEVCQKEEDSGMLILSVVVDVHMCECEGEKTNGHWGLSKRLKNGALDSEHGASKG